jgi:CRISPR-associated protein Csc1
MVLYHCHLTLHDNVFFASREMGILYETEKYLHNWALSYALFEAVYIPKPYRLQGKNAQKPAYLDGDREQNLLHLNRAQIYVFPAQPLRCSYQINTFKAAQVNYYGISKQFGATGANRNYPINYGRAKELAVGSRYQTYIIAPPEVKFPAWIRLGKWAAKIKVDVTPIPDSGIKKKSGEYVCQHPLNPVDLPQSCRLLLYNRIVMPPVSLLSQAQLIGEYLEISKPNQGQEMPEWSQLTELSFPINLPLGVAYGANTIAV